MGRITDALAAAATPRTRSVLRNQLAGIGVFLLDTRHQRPYSRSRARYVPNPELCSRGVRAPPTAYGENQASTQRAIARPDAASCGTAERARRRSRGLQCKTRRERACGRAGDSRGKELGGQ